MISWIIFPEQGRHVLRQGSQVKYGFIKAHAHEFSVRRMCYVLGVHFSGFYAWLKKPLSNRAREDVRQSVLLKDAWHESGKVYGYRKLHSDLRDQCEAISLNRAERLARMEDIKAQIGYKCRHSSYVQLICALHWLHR